VLGIRESLVASLVLGSQCIREIAIVARNSPFLMGVRNLLALSQLQSGLAPTPSRSDPPFRKNVCCYHNQLKSIGTDSKSNGEPKCGKR
jgi:hypothetical protein